MLKILVLGGSGLIGNKILKKFKNQFDIISTHSNNPPSNNIHSIKISLPDDLLVLKNLIEKEKPDVVINAMAYSNLDFCEDHKKDTFLLHVEMTEKISSICENNVSIGDKCVIHNNTMICAETLIESCVFIGPGVSFTNNSPIGHLRDVPSTIRGAKLRFGCAIGGGATICPGIEIGQESIIAAGAVVTKDIPSRIIVAGNPAKKIKDVENESFIKEDVCKEYDLSQKQI